MTDRLKVIIYYYLFINEIYSSPLLVEIEQGKLTGKILYDINGNEIHSFLSIPYAKTPVGDLRFKAPKYPEKWSGILDASMDSPMCVQQDQSGKIIGQEDCLYLNVYTPRISVDLKPVMVYIHGGSFIFGNNIDYGPEFLLTEGIILVAINYRLGLFGFLNYEDPSVGAPGNVAFKDQNMALRWVQKNIDKFGGNPNNVTIFGISCGGVSIHLHVLSPMSRGLFHRAIAQSGTALNIWSKGMANSGPLAARTLGFKGLDNGDSLKYLQKQTIEQIMSAQENCTLIIPIQEPVLIGYVVERQSNEPAFLMDSPENIINSKKFSMVPFILGFTDAEGILVENFYLLTLKKRSFPLTQYIPYDLNITNDAKKLEISNKIIDFYSVNDTLKTLELDTDAFFAIGVHKSAVAHAKQQHENLYLYVFSADTKLNFMKLSQPETSKLKGASHGDDVGYLFKNEYTPNIDVGTTERFALERVVKMWTNFAKFGNPTYGSGLNVVWDPVTGANINYLDIGTDGLKMGTDPLKDRMKFWDEIYENYTRQSN